MKSWAPGWRACGQSYLSTWRRTRVSCILHVITFLARHVATSSSCTGFEEFSACEPRASSMPECWRLYNCKQSHDGRLNLIWGPRVWCKLTGAQKFARTQEASYMRPTSPCRFFKSPPPTLPGRGRCHPLTCISCLRFGFQSTLHPAHTHSEKNCMPSTHCS